MDDIHNNIIKEPSTSEELIDVFNNNVKNGEDWILSLLRLISVWTLPSENYLGIEYKYLILGEALDWLSLANRLSLGVKEYIDEKELENLLVKGKLPDRFLTEDFKTLLGPIKYGYYLNYWYGVVIEEGIQNSIEKDVRKRHIALCFQDNEELSEQVFEQLYGINRKTLVRIFMNELNKNDHADMCTTELIEFTYWLHKLRINKWDPARVASDTKRGILELELLNIYSY
jgi:hypothetical protein